MRLCQIDLFRPLFLSVAALAALLAFACGGDEGASDEGASDEGTEVPREPVQEDITLDGQTISTLHSPFDIGVIAEAFDGDINTVARTAKVNPAVFELSFPEPRSLTGLTVTTSVMEKMTFTATIFSDTGGEPAVYSQEFKNDSPPDLTVDLNFDPVPPPTKKIRIEVKNLNDSEFGIIHVYEIVLR